MLATGAWPGDLASPQKSLWEATSSAFFASPEPAVATSPADFAAVAEDEWIVRYSSGLGDTQLREGSPLLAAARQAGVAASFSRLTAQEFDLLHAPGTTERQLASWAALDR